MALSPIAFIAPNFTKFNGYWLKAYFAGSTTPKSMALDSAGLVTVAKLQLNADGFLESAGGALVIPYIDGSYDAWLFPTEAEADSNDTVNAEQVADDITGFNDTINNLENSLRVLPFDTLNLALNESNPLKMFDGATLNLAGRSAKNDGGDAMWDVYPSGTFTVGPTIADVFDHATLPLQLKLRESDEVRISQLGINGWDSALNYKTLIIDVDITKTGTYVIPASQEIIFRSTTVSQNDNLAAFEAPNAFWAITGNGKIKRIGAAPTVEIVGSIGISVLQGSVEHNITGNIEISNFAQAGAVFDGGGIIAGDVSYASTVGLRCFGNWNGIEFLDGFSSEYHSISNTWCKLNHNDGVLLESGNITWHGGGIVSNGRANVHLKHPDAGGNPHHGVFNGVLINHGSVYQIWADHVNMGHIFANCMFFDNVDKSIGRIRLENSRNISINGGILACAVEYIDDGSHVHRGYNNITNMDVRNDVTVDDPTKRIFRSGNYKALGTWELNDRERFNATKRTNTDTSLSGFSSYNLTQVFAFTVVDNRDAVDGTFGTIIQPYDADVVTDIDADLLLSTPVSPASILTLRIDVNQTGSYVDVKSFRVEPMADPTGLIVHLKASHTFSAPKDAQIAWFLQPGNAGSNTIKELGLMRFIANY